ncbi:HAD-IIA family hydrolase [Rudaeicoccus suwonensis]|uniref:HAD-IIA family hydrolase n=1 Tax=Rudaeicoccus suwonensis TaxID=657409 RepID=UPI001FE583D9|nr:HAD-IIA family hydrolase [Rudaeicoccus suwonensis]
MSIPLMRSYPAMVFDLDGVVYRGPDPVPHAVDTLSSLRDAGTGIVFATNNASRTPTDVARQLQSLGVAAEPAEVLTSALAGATVLRNALAPGAQVLAIGGDGVARALESVGLTPKIPVQHSADDGPTGAVAAVLQGYGASVSASDLAEAAYAIQSGARWIATNDDLTLPTNRGVAPGNGSLVAAVRIAVDSDPEVVGKPGPLMYELAARQLGQDAAHTLGVGDRLDTDIAGAHAAGMDSLLVLTGVHGPQDLVRAPKSHRPRYIGTDLRTLSAPYDEPIHDADDRWSASGLVASLKGSADKPRVAFEGDASVAPEQADVIRLRLALRVLWSALDRGKVSVASAVSAVTAAQ